MAIKLGSTNIPFVIRALLERFNLIPLLVRYNEGRFRVTFQILYSLNTIQSIIDDTISSIRVQGKQSEFAKKLGPTWEVRIRNAIYNDICKATYYLLYREAQDPLDKPVLSDYNTVFPGSTLLGNRTLLQIFNSTTKSFEISDFGILDINYVLDITQANAILDNPAYPTADWKSLPVPFNDTLSINDLLTAKAILPSIDYSPVTLPISGTQHLPIGDLLLQESTPAKKKKTNPLDYCLLDFPMLVSINLALNMLMDTKLVYFSVFDLDFSNFYTCFETSDSFTETDSFSSTLIKRSPKYKPLIFELFMGYTFNYGVKPEDIQGRSSGNIPIPKTPVPGGPQPSTRIDGEPSGPSTASAEPSPPKQPRPKTPRKFLESHPIEVDQSTLDSVISDTGQAESELNLLISQTRDVNSKIAGTSKRDVGKMVSELSNYTLKALQIMNAAKQLVATPRQQLLSIRRTAQMPFMSAAEAITYGTAES